MKKLSFTMFMATMAVAQFAQAVGAVYYAASRG